MEPAARLAVPLYHITEIANLPQIIASGGLLSDARVAAVPHEVIGYDHIKQRRLTEYKVSCCGGRFVGEFVPFYYCPRSPMLYSVNIGATGKPPGHQREIVHLCTRVGVAVEGADEWALSDGNAGAGGVSFYRDLAELDGLDWDAIHAIDWRRRTRAKMAEFLVLGSFPWAKIRHVGCYDHAAVARVKVILEAADQATTVDVRRGWYY